MSETVKLKPVICKVRTMSRAWAKDHNLEHIVDGGDTVQAFRFQGSWWTTLDFTTGSTGQAYINPTMFSAIILDEYDVNGDWVKVHFEYERS